jgi:hypothetical protein
MQHDFILLDRSGSMAELWKEALGAVNAYAKKLADDKVDTGITVAVFDTGSDGALDFKVVRDRITPPTFVPLTDADAIPRASTPLNDAVGRIVALAQAGGYDKVAIVIMTDGYENASRELTVQQAKALLDVCRQRNWQVVFLGANFDNTRQGASYGNATHATASASTVNLQASGTLLASKRAAYGATGQSISFSAAEKKNLADDKKPLRLSWDKPAA